MARPKVGDTELINYGVSLLSGGLDSTTVTTLAGKEIDRLTAVTFAYGQRHSVELVRSGQIAELLGIRHEIIDITFLKEVAWYSALLDPEEFALPQVDQIDSRKGSIPNTYVPIRNTIFIALAMAYLESKVLYDIEVAGQVPGDVTSKIFLAPNVVDYSGYPDCRPEFFISMGNTINLGSKLFNQYGIRTELVTPVIQMSKAQIIELGTKVGAPLNITWSCYKGGKVPCHQCDSCVFRAKGFFEAGIIDPAL
jgi:7-cyano-7-deazaguanine synthase